MARKKQDPSTDNAGQPADVVPPNENNPDVDLPPEMQEVGKTWAKRPDPFGFQSVRWQDGYAIALKESDANREIFIQFGSGQRTDQPMAFEAIKKMFKEEYGMYWDAKVQGWAKGLKPGITPLIKEQNRKLRGAVEEAFSKAIELAEAVRGSSLSEQGRGRGGAPF
jgi:hypothetical protein